MMAVWEVFECPPPPEDGGGGGGGGVVSVAKVLNRGATACRLTGLTVAWVYCRWIVSLDWSKAEATYSAAPERGGNSGGGS